MNTIWVILYICGYMNTHALPVKISWIFGCISGSDNYIRNESTYHLFYIERPLRLKKVRKGNYWDTSKNS